MADAPACHAPGCRARVVHAEVKGEVGASCSKHASWSQRLRDAGYRVVADAPALPPVLEGAMPRRWT